MKRNVAERVKTILQELNLPINHSDERNKETLFKFLTDHGCQGTKNYPRMKHFYEEFKTKGESPPEPKVLFKPLSNIRSSRTLH